MLGQTARPLALGGQLARPSPDPALLRQLVGGLVAAVLLETLLLRLTTRVGVHLPKEGAVSDAFQVASLLGSVAFNFASILAIGLAVVLLASIVLRQGKPAPRRPRAG